MKKVMFAVAFALSIILANLTCATLFQNNEFLRFGLTGFSIAIILGISKHLSDKWFPKNE